MYAVIKTGGKQYRVEEGQTLLVEKLGQDDGDVELTPVLLVDGDTVVSSPDALAKATVSAKVLGEGAQPVQRLKLYNTPRWTLPAMRLVVEQRLRSDAPAARLTLQDAQHMFDELADSGAGLRWADVPSEAALGLPEARQLLAGSWDELTVEDGIGWIVYNNPEKHNAMTAAMLAASMRLSPAT